MKLPTRAVALMSASVVLAGSSGILAATALTQGSAAPVPSKTVTISVTNGEPGPAGPPGPPGPAGAVECPDGSTYGKLVINSPGGHVSIYTCIVDE